MWLHLILLPLLAPPLSAGAAARAITPDLSSEVVYLAGYGPSRRATEIHDDVWARALVIQAGDRRVALVALDLIGWFLPDVERSRERLAAEAGIDHLIVCSTHTHSGPDTIGLWGATWFVSGRSPAYIDRVRRDLEQCVLDAVASMRDARLALARGKVEGLVGDSRPPQVIDETLTVLVADALDGSPIFTLTHYPVHPEVLGRERTLVSSDFPHHLRERLEARRGGTAIHVVGSIGGLMTPRNRGLIDPETGAPPVPGSLRMMRLYGEHLADRAVALIERADPIEGALGFETRDVFIPLENGYYRLAFALGVVPGRTLYTDGAPDSRRIDPVIRGFPSYALGRELRTEIAVVTLGPLTLACVPGEIYPEIPLGRIPDPDPARDFQDCVRETALLDLLPGRHKLVLGLANDEIGYIIPRCQWDEEPPYTFGMTRKPYGEINSVGPEAAPRIMSAFQALLESSADEGDGPR